MTQKICREDGFFMMSLGEIMNDAALKDSLIDWFRVIFNAVGKGEFGENWDYDSSYKRVFGRHKEPGHMAAVILKNGAVAGASLVQLGSLEMVYRQDEAPDELNTLGHYEMVRRTVGWFAGDGARLLYYRELGLRKDYRGCLRDVIRLIVGPLNHAISQGVDFAFLRTTKGGKLFPLMAGFDVRLLVDCGDSHGYCILGDHPATCHRRFTADSRLMAKMLVERSRLHVQK